MSASAPEPQDDEGAKSRHDVVHERRGQQSQDHAEVEADERTRNANQGGGDIAPRSRAEARQPTARVAVEKKARHAADDENDDEIEKGGAADGHWSVTLRTGGSSASGCLIGIFGFLALSCAIAASMSSCSMPMI